MAPIYSGSALDSLLRVLVELGGDRLLLETGKAPQALTGSRPLRLTMPPTSSSMLRVLCGPMAVAHAGEAPSSAGSRYRYALSGDSFEVRIQGALDDGASATVLVVRSSEEDGPKSPSGSEPEPPSRAGERSGERELPSARPSHPTGLDTVPHPESAVDGRSSEPLPPRRAPPAPGAGRGSPGRSPNGVGGSAPWSERPSSSNRSGYWTAASAVQHGGREAVARDSEPAASSSRPPRPSTRAPKPSPLADPSLAAAVERAVALGASDLHLTEGESPMLRVLGALRTLEMPPIGVESLLTVGQRERVAAGEALDLSMSFGAATRLRLNVFSSEQGLCAAVRLLTRSAPDLDELGLPAEVKALARCKPGLVLFCGPTGAGKSTTLAALTERILERSAVLAIALESPIEYLLGERGGPGRVRQREVGRHVTSFAAGLRDALREDPDLLLIGEMRDAETIALALTAAETGHLVLSSLHGRSARSALERIVDSFPHGRQSQVRGQLADSLRAVVSHRLLPRRRGDDRAAASEVLTINAAAANLIREGRLEQLPTVMQSGKHAGMLPLERDLARLVREGQVERGVARQHATTLPLFDQLC